MTHHSEPAEAVACLYTVQGDSRPFMRISRRMLHVAGDIVAVQPLGPLPATPPAPVESAQVKVKRDDPFSPAVDVDADDDYYPAREED